MRRYLLPLAMLILIAAVLVWAWSRLPVHTVRPSSTSATPRAAFDGSQPLRLAVPDAAAGDAARVQRWLRDELDEWLAHEPRLRYSRAPLAQGTVFFTLAVQPSPDGQLRLRLIGVDGHVERERSVPSQSIGLPFARSLAEAVSQVLALKDDLQAHIGTSNPEHYGVVTQAREHLREAPDGSLAPAQLKQRRVADIDALERVTKQDKKYERAWSTLAVAYLHMQGEDSASLDSLALNAADKAIALDTKAAEAQAVRGYVQYRRGQWLGAHEQLVLALQLQPTSRLALTGLACLLVDAGLSSEALALAERAAKAAPTDGDARECLVYARAATHAALVQPNEPELPLSAARVVATVQMLEGDLANARTTYESAIAREHRQAPWLPALLEAASDRTHSVSALRSITAAASEDQVDASTEMLAGLALKRSDFVFNRLLRLQKSGQFTPLRMLWLPQATSLRKHPRFDDVLSASNLATFWARHGKPDVCAHEPRIVACR